MPNGAGGRKVNHFATFVTDLEVDDSIDLITMTEIYSEKELTDRIVGGEKSLFELFVRRFNPVLYKTGRSYGFSHEDVEDLMQETFIDAYKNLPGFEGRSSLKTWITRIMLNNCYRKKHKVNSRVEASFSSYTIEQENKIGQMKTADLQEGILRKEISRIMESALLTIPYDYRIVYTLRELNEISTRETAELLEITESNVKARLSRSKLMLRNVVEKMYRAEDIFEFNLVYCDRIVNNVMAVINKI